MPHDKSHDLKSGKWGTLFNVERENTSLILNYTHVPVSATMDSIISIVNFVICGDRAMVTI